MSSVTHLKALQALEAAVKTGSLKAAADLLAVTPAAAGQRIKSLEDFLGFELIVRGRSGIRPTTELKSAMPHLSAAFRELQTVAEILDFQRSQEIHIAADADLAELWLAPRLARFRRRFPNIRFCVNGTGDVPLRPGDPDCVIEFGAPSGRPHEIRLFRDYLLPVCSPENTRRISVLDETERLEGFPLLHLDCYRADPAAIGWPEWIDRHGHRKTAAGRGIRYRHVVHALEAVYSNAGIMLCGLALLIAEIERNAVSLPFGTAKGAWSSHGYVARFSASALHRNFVPHFQAWLVAEGQATEARLLEMTKRA